MRISDWSSDVCSSDLAQKGIQITLRLDLISNAQTRQQATRERHSRFPVRQSKVGHLCQEGNDDIGFLAKDIQIRLRKNQNRIIRSEEHTPELQSLMRISYADVCLKNKILIHVHKLIY